ncbi:hypothetical protein D9M71_719290 [compost metagenome]
MRSGLTGPVNTPWITNSPRWKSRSLPVLANSLKRLRVAFRLRVKSALSFIPPISAACLSRRSAMFFASSSRVSPLTTWRSLPPLGTIGEPYSSLLQKSWARWSQIENITRFGYSALSPSHWKKVGTSSL